jgi:hypothetical protein
VSLGPKLQLRPGQRVAVIGAPTDVTVAWPTGVVGTSDAASADAVVVFAATRAELDERCAAVVDAARADRLAWVAYPKAGQLGTDLNRDILARLLTARGVQPVRQVAIDGTWSALRFRPAAAGLKHSAG